MSLVNPICFLGLSPLERRQQLYEAAYNISTAEDLVDPACFYGLSREEQESNYYAAILGIATGLDNTYLANDGSNIFQPDGTSQYLQP